MTIAEIRRSKKTVLTPEDVCEVLSCRRHNINLQAQNDPSKLGFPVIVMGSRVKIPREAFLRFWDGMCPTTQEHQDKEDLFN